MNSEVKGKRAMSNSNPLNEEKKQNNKDGTNIKDVGGSNLSPKSETLSNVHWSSRHGITGDDCTV